MTDALVLAQALLRADSVTPARGAVFDVLEAALVPLGFAVDRFVTGEAPDGPVENMIATRPGTGRHLAFAGHVDVVPPGEGWTGSPWSGAVRGDLLYGRGAVDMKGAVAAFVAAAAQVPDSGPLSLLITGDEEGPATFGKDQTVGGDDRDVGRQRGKGGVFVGAFERYGRAHGDAQRLRAPLHGGGHQLAPAVAYNPGGGSATSFSIAAKASGSPTGFAVVCERPRSLINRPIAGTGKFECSPEDLAERLRHLRRMPGSSQTIGEFDQRRSPEFPRFSTRDIQRRSWQPR